jgi:hypothetical protein
VVIKRLLLESLPQNSLPLKPGSSYQAEAALFMPLLGMTFLSQFGEINITGDKLTLTK